jgi:hypothetical protein
MRVPSREPSPSPPRSHHASYPFESKPTEVAPSPCTVRGFGVRSPAAAVAAEAIIARGPLQKVTVTKCDRYKCDRYNSLCSFSLLLARPRSVAHGRPGACVASEAKASQSSPPMTAVPEILHAIRAASGTEDVDFRFIRMLPAELAVVLEKVHAHARILLASGVLRARSTQPRLFLRRGVPGRRAEPPHPGLAPRLRAGRSRYSSPPPSHQQPLSPLSACIHTHTHTSSLFTAVRFVSLLSLPG